MHRIFNVFCNVGDILAIYPYHLDTKFGGEYKFVPNIIWKNGGETQCIGSPFDTVEQCIDAIASELEINGVVIRITRIKGII